MLSVGQLVAGKERRQQCQEMWHLWMVRRKKPWLLILETSLPTAIRETAASESHMAETGEKTSLKSWERYSKTLVSSQQSPSPAIQQKGTHGDREFKRHPDPFYENCSEGLSSRSLSSQSSEQP